MPGYTLLPVDYQPDFSDYSLVPVDYDPFAADGPIQQARTQLASQPQPNAGFDQPPSALQTPGSALPLPQLCRAADRRPPFRNRRDKIHTRNIRPCGRCLATATRCSRRCSRKYAKP